MKLKNILSNFAENRRFSFFVNIKYFEIQNKTGIPASKILPAKILHFSRRTIMKSANRNRTGKREVSK
jgi:hypothetical protein